MKRVRLLLLVLIAGGVITACGREAAKAAPESGGQGTELQGGQPGESEVKEQSAAPEQSAGGYEDNFSVPSEDAAEFAAKIQAAVKAQDIEALADLAAYPLYIGLEQGGISVSSGDALLKLGEETIFTPELLEAVDEVDEASLAPSKAGFVLPKDGHPNIVFGVRDGELAVQGINY